VDIPVAEDMKVLDVVRDRRKQTESLMRTVCGSGFQTDGAENRKARLHERSVTVNGWISSGITDERRVQL